MRHILDRLEITVSRPAGWRPANSYEARENYLLRCLLNNKMRAENWIPAKTSGTENERPKSGQELRLLLASSAEILSPESLERFIELRSWRRRVVWRVASL